MDLKWLKEMLDRPGYSGRGLAKALGIDPAGVTRILQGKRKVSTVEVPLINAYLRVKPEMPHNDVVTNRPPLLVWLAVGDGQGAFMLTDKIVGEIDRPQRLSRAEKAFVFRVVGDENDPVFEIGDELIIDPESPRRSGDACLFTNEAAISRGAQSVVARLVRATAEDWVVEHYPKRGEQKLSKFRFPQAWRVVGRFMRG